MHEEKASGGTVARASDSERIAAVEEGLRALASAAGAVRLYPASSPMREEAIQRAGLAAASMAASGPVRLTVDRERFLFESVPVGAGRPAIAALAESLHALQVGQIIIAPGVTTTEVAALLEVLSREAREVRTSGGARAALVAAGAQNLALVEVSLRASDREGLAGVDLVSAPLQEIASHLPAACERWSETALGDAPHDAVAESLSGIEPAMRDLALARIAQSLLLLDEQTRLDLMQAALQRSPSGAPMEGMLAALAKMPPAALARLLRLVADQRGVRPDDLLREIALPPELLREVKALVQPIPASDPVRGIPENVNPAALAAEAETDETDQLVVEALIREATPASTAGRALAASIEVFERKRDAESVQALADAATVALRAGALDSLPEAIALLAEAVGAPDLAESGSAAARAIATEIVEAAPRLDAEQRGAILRAAARVSEHVAAVAGAELSAGEDRRAIGATQVLLGLGDKRLVGIAARALEHPSSQVRLAAVRALADNGSPEAATALASALRHPDLDTALAAVREITRVRLDDALPTLLRVLADDSPLRRNHELKLEILSSIERMRYRDARETVARLAARKPLRKKTRQIVQRARQVLAALDAEGRDEGMRST